MTVFANHPTKTQSNISPLGTGLSDGYPPGGIDAHDVCSAHVDAFLTDILYTHSSQSNKFLERLPYDLMTIGKCVVFFSLSSYTFRRPN